MPENSGAPGRGEPAGAPRTQRPIGYFENSKQVSDREGFEKIPAGRAYFRDRPAMSRMGPTAQDAGVFDEKIDNGTGDLAYGAP
jgi:hypothetical protein